MRQDFSVLCLHLQPNGCVTTSVPSKLCLNWPHALNLTQGKLSEFILYGKSSRVRAMPLFFCIDCMKCLGQAMVSESRMQGQLAEAKQNWLW